MITKYHEFEIYHPVSGYLKIYPDHLKYIHFNQPRNVRTSGFEEIFSTKNIRRSTTSDPDTLAQSLRQTKGRLTDLVLCNSFQHFATFTFDPKKSDRTNPEELKNKMSKWLKNQREIHGKFQYLIVPEFHKDGKALHFHAFLKNYNGKLKDSGKLINTRTAYNIQSYRLGHSTLVKIDNTEKVSNYVKKYITKDMPLFPGKKRYWASQNLNRPIVVENPTLNSDQLAQATAVFHSPLLTVYNLPVTLQELAINQGEVQWNTETYQNQFTQLSLKNDTARKKTKITSVLQLNSPTGKSF